MIGWTLTDILVGQAAITCGPSTEATSHVVHLLGCRLAGVFRVSYHVACGSCHQCVSADWTVKAIAAPEHNSHNIGNDNIIVQ